jgi:hypothetical protein
VVEHVNPQMKKFLETSPSADFLDSSLITKRTLLLTDKFTLYSS